MKSTSGVASIARRWSPFGVLIGRSELQKFAKSKKQYPKFLFDTVSPEEAEADGEFEGAETDPKPLNIVTPPATTKLMAGQNPAAPVEPQRKPGRPAKYNWDGCIAEIVRIADEDGLPKIQNELIRRLQSWFIGEIDDAPAESEIKRRVSPIYKYLESVGWKSKDG